MTSRNAPFKKAKSDPARLLALKVIGDVIQRGAYSNLRLPKALAESSLDERDRAFATEIVYGTLRMQGLYDLILTLISTRPWKDVDPDIQDIVRMGAHQIFSMRVAEHAAVSATVDLARITVGEPAGSFTNALMRKLLAHSLDEWLEQMPPTRDPVVLLARRYSHPEWIVSAYWDLLKSEELVEKELISNNTPATPTLVAWPGDSSVEDLLEFGGERTEYSSYGVRGGTSPYANPLVTSRRAGVQDEGSQLVASIFFRANQGAHSMLDLCAGPGGKAALLSHLAFEAGVEFTANEISEPRAALVEQVVKNTPVRVGDGRTIGDDGHMYDAILADVPCTGIGALRRRPEVRWRRTLKDLSSLLALQYELADAAISVLNPGGVLGYATCSPHYAETSGQVARILKEHPEMELIPVNPYLPEGLEGAVRNGSLSLWGHEHNTDAMFLALLRKKA